MHFNFYTKTSTLQIQVEPAKGRWLADLLPKLNPHNPVIYSWEQVKTDYENAGFDDFELFWDNKPVNTLYKAGLLAV